MRRTNLIAIGVSLAISGMFGAAAMPNRKNAAGAGNPNKGQQIYAQCASCHNADSALRKVGPGLKGLFKKKILANGMRPTEAGVRAMIEQGGKGMPSYQSMLSAQQKKDLIAYLRTL